MNTARSVCLLSPKRRLSKSALNNTLKVIPNRSSTRKTYRQYTYSSAALTGYISVTAPFSMQDNQKLACLKNCICFMFIKYEVLRLQLNLEDSVLQIVRIKVSYSSCKQECFILSG